MTVDPTTHVILTQLESECPPDMEILDYYRFIKEVQFGRRKPAAPFQTKLSFTAYEGGHVEVSEKPLMYLP
jgi:hypothetical protein